ncbi:UNVERIFIED_CONTAM: hypothetical protein Sradi_2044900 [Sesamum radiatum]|uniref:Uncharacterized protein n=1 Tax=Sesamum radiatum TaxID=300843 RepID=A0AAW2TKD3_SESRA
MLRTSVMGKAEASDPPWKGVIRMITGGSAGGDSQRARKAQVREAYRATVKEIMDVEPANDAPLIQFDQEEHSEPRIPGNCALVITALLANYEIERVFIDSGSSIDILFGEAYDQMPLGDVVLETVDTLLEEKGYWRKYRVKEILTNKEKIRYLGQSAQRLGQNTTKKPQSRFNRWKILPVELLPGDPDKITKIESKMKKDVREQVINCLRKNKDIFTWTPQYVEGIDPDVITHHLNVDPNIRPAEQKKRHFGPEKDKIIQGDVNKLLTAEHIRKIQFPEWLSNIVLVPKPGGKWRMCIDFRDLNKACPKDYY